MLIMIRTKVKNAAVLIVKTIEDMDEFELCLFIFLSIYNARNIGTYFGRKYPELGLHLKSILVNILQ